MSLRIVKLKSRSTLLKRSEFFEREVVDGLKGCTPGQWVEVVNSIEPNERILCIANPLSQKSAPLKVIRKLNVGESFSEKQIEAELTKLLNRAIRKRDQFSSLFSNYNCRLIYGVADQLPGVIADSYENAILLQINSAGLDEYRDFVADYLTQKIEKKVYFFDNAQYRSSEGLPQFDSNFDLTSLKVYENKLNYELSSEALQKIGYYYDHRINRQKLAQWIAAMGDSDLSQAKGVDLFSYCGAWGMNCLQAGLGHVDFVDQGNFTDVIESNLAANGFSQRGSFHRADVFNWLSNCDSTYDVVISDPPAFSKSLKNKSKALGGYQKLHRQLSKIVHKGSWLAIGSCTHGVSVEELDHSVKLAFTESGHELQLLDLGVQAPDHPTSHLADNSNYIKFILYRVL